MMLRALVQMAAVLCLPHATAVAQPASTPNELVAQQLAIAADLIKPAVVSIDSDLSGKGLVVGRKGTEWLVATAAHVVAAVEDGGEVGLTVFLDDSKQVQVIGQLVSGDDNPAQDLAFIRIPNPPTQYLPEYGAFEQLYPTTYAVDLGGAGEWRAAQSAGQVVASDVPDILSLQAARIGPSYSGGPLIGAGGVVGIMLKRDQNHAAVLAIGAIRHRFEASFAPAGWIWLPRPVPPPAPVGFVQLARLDTLGGIIAMQPERGEATLVQNDRLTPVKAGRYQLHAQTSMGNALNCQPAQIVVQPSGTFRSSLTCSLDITGLWVMGPHVLEIRPLGLGHYSAILSNDPYLSGQGDGNFDGTYLQLNINLPMGGSWSARLRAAPDQLAGEVTQASFYLGPQPLKLLFVRKQGS